MKTLAALLLTLISINSFGQWSCKMNDNGIDDPFRLVTTTPNNWTYLRLYSPVILDFEKSIDSTVIIKHPADTTIKMFYSPEHPEGVPDTIINSRQELKTYSHFDTLVYVSLDLLGARISGSSCKVDIVLMVNGERKHYTHTGNTHTKYKGVELYRIKFKLFNGVYTPVDSDFYNDFKAASTIRVRVSCEYCDDQYYEFSQKGSTAALNYILK